MDRNILVGLIGYGIGGQVFHAPIITAVEGLVLKKIRAVRPEQVKLANNRYPGAELVTHAEDIITDPAIGLVVIASPNALHLPMAKQALEAGKHVVVDKPFTIGSAEADELIALAARKQKILSVFQSRRFDSDFRTIQQVIKSGLLGNLVEMESRYDRFRNFLKPNAWREEDIPGSGLLYDLGSHLIDQALTLFGLPGSVTAFILRQRKGSKVDDNFELILHYPGIKATLKSGMLVRESLQRFVLLGEQGSFVKKGMDVQEEALKAGLTPETAANWGMETEEIWGMIHTTVNGVQIRGKLESSQGDYRIFYQNIYAAITRKEALLVTAEQARNVIRIIELAQRSEAEKRTIEYSYDRD
jgi:scyllo-inositol 2-dehydrogenase (NADP+)